MVTTTPPTDPALAAVACRSLPDVTPTVILADAVEEAGDPDAAAWVREAAALFVDLTADDARHARGYAHDTTGLLLGHARIPEHAPRLRLALFAYLWQLTPDHDRPVIRFAWLAVLGLASGLTPASIGDTDLTLGRRRYRGFTPLVQTAAESLAAGDVLATYRGAVDWCKQRGIPAPTRRLAGLLQALLPTWGPAARRAVKRGERPQETTTAGEPATVG